MHIEVWKLLLDDDDGITCVLHPSYEAAWADLLDTYGQILLRAADGKDLDENVVAELLGDAGIQYRIDSALLNPAHYRQVAASSS